jgi:hypothetical protein
MIGTRRAFLLGGLSLALAGPSTAKRRKHKKRKRDNEKQVTQSHDTILADLAERMVFGVRDEGTSLEDLEAILARGEVVEALCGTHANLATRELRRQGVMARRVGALQEPYGGDSSHVMLEVRVNGAWQCYDIMSNTQAIDSSGKGISVVAWCAANGPRWRRIASDANWPQTDAELDGIYARVLETPWIEDASGYAVFHDPARASAIVAARSWLVPVDRETWQALL